MTTGPVLALLDAVTAREQERETLTRDLRALDAAGKTLDWRKLERDLQAKLRDAETIADLLIQLRDEHRSRP